MTEIERHIIVSALEDAGLDTEKVLYEGYVGRYMYGAHCFGITGTARTLVMFFIQLSEEPVADDLVRVMQQDSLGLEDIYYFPGYTVTEG